MYTDIVTQNGRAVLVTGSLFTDPSDAMWLRAAARSNVIVAVAQFQGRCQMADSQGHRWDSGEVALGAQCVGIVVHPDGWQITWMRAPYGATYGRTVLDLELREIGPRTVTPCEGTSQGFWNVALDAEPIWADSHMFVRFPGLTLSHWTTIEPWTIGQDRTSGARVSAWNAAQQKPYEVSRIDTPVPSHLAIEADGTAVVVVGFTEIMVREPQFIPWQPWPPDPPVPPVPPIPPIPPLPPIPVEFLLMAEIEPKFALRAKNLVKSTVPGFTDRWNYPVPGGFLSVDGATGQFRSAPATVAGPSESFYWVMGSGQAVVDTGGVKGVWKFIVAEGL